MVTLKSNCKNDRVHTFFFSTDEAQAKQSSKQENLIS